MAYDMTKCDGGSCPFKIDCYRFTSETLGRQDFFGSVPYNATENSCEYFWDNTSQIQVVAYHIWEKAGKPHGQDVAHWQQAKTEILDSISV